MKKVMKFMEHQKSLKNSRKRTCDIRENSRKLYAGNAYKSTLYKTVDKNNNIKRFFKKVEKYLKKRF